MQQPHTHQRPGKFLVLVSAMLATVAAVLGHDMVVCRGIVAGAVSATMRAGFLAYVHAPTFIALAGLSLAFLGVVYVLMTRPPFRDRKELVTFVLPVCALALGAAAGALVEFGILCALHPWR